MVLSLGELILRLSTTDFRKLEQAPSFAAHYGGSEANVLIGLSLVDVPGRFLTMVPDSPIGTAAVRHLNQFTIDTTFIHRGGERLGVYYLEHGSSIRPGKIVYDRKHASFNNLTSDQVDLDNLFSGINWVHWSGITPALSENAARLCLHLITEARRRGLPVSCDLHYRANLWQYGKSPRDIIPGLLKNTTHLVGDPNAIRQMTTAKDTQASGFLSEDELFDSFEAIHKEFPHLECIGMLSRKIHSASDNELTALLYHGSRTLSKTYRISPITDRIGGGDAFMTGIIHGYISGLPENEIIDWAAALAAYKHTLPGDHLEGSVEDFKACMRGEHGKLKR